MVKGATQREGEEDGVALGKTVLCWDKIKCRRHTSADLEDLIEMTVDNGYLRSVRTNTNEKGWENMPETCWKCSDLF